MRSRRRATSGLAAHRRDLIENLWGREGFYGRFVFDKPPSARVDPRVHTYSPRRGSPLNVSSLVTAASNERFELPKPFFSRTHLIDWTPLYLLSVS